jgi:transposase
MVSENNSVVVLITDSQEHVENSPHGLFDSTKTPIPDPQVNAVAAPKRKFTKAYKLQTLTAYDACCDASERGALLRREGLYYSCIPAWRNQLGMTKDGGKGTSSSKRTEHLLREMEQLKKRLAQAEAIIDIQKKVSALFGTHILPHESSVVNS